MKNICIIFGAGAETGFNICNGEIFSKTVLGIDCENLNAAVEKYYRGLLDDELKEWYPRYYETEWKIEDLLKAAVRKKYLLEKFDTKKNYDDEVKKKTGDLLKNGDNLEQKEIINNYSNYMGIIDEHFHTLINPKILGPEKFWRVVNCYTRAYASIIGNIRNSKTVDDYLNILRDKKENLEYIKQFADDNSEKDSYYNILRDYSNVKVITTNYTSICENISRIPESNIAYIHGKLKWFESSRDLVVYDSENDELPKDILFPYIFIQSGIKPIVDAKQLNEYCKALSFLQEADEVFVIGYNLNADDNHFNGLLKSFILSKKKIVYFDYEKTDADNRKLEISRALRLSAEEEKFIDYIMINRNNCYGIFRKKLEERFGVMS